MRRLVRPAKSSTPKTIHATERPSEALQWHIWPLDGIASTLTSSGIAYQIDNRVNGPHLSFTLRGVEVSLEVQNDPTIWTSPFVLPALLRCQIDSRRDFCLQVLQGLANYALPQNRPFTLSISTHGSHTQVCRPKASKAKASKRTGEVHYSLSH